MNSFKLNKIAVLGLIIASAMLSTLADTPALAGKGRGTYLAITAALSTDEARELTYMREEEKLARDVYLSLYKQWNAVIFNNIASSEQRHMDALEKKIVLYNLTDPVVDESIIGEFTNPDLKALYTTLIESGSISLIDGLKVGANIEEIDILDIQNAIAVTTHIDVVTVYQNLQEGSKNHLRAYVKSLALLGVVYTPQYISQELYDAIMEL